MGTGQLLWAECLISRGGLEDFSGFISGGQEAERIILSPDELIRAALPRKA